jgi:hypothetical protein
MMLKIVVGQGVSGRRLSNALMDTIRDLANDQAKVCAGVAIRPLRRPDMPVQKEVGRIEEILIPGPDRHIGRQGQIRPDLLCLMLAANTLIMKKERNAKTGAVSFIQKFGSSLNLHPHYHCAVLDGVFQTTPAGNLEFCEATMLNEAAITEISQTVRQRILAYFVRHNLLTPSDAEEMRSWEHNGGFSVDASVRIESWDRSGLEQGRMAIRPYHVTVPGRHSPWSAFRFTMAPPSSTTSRNQIHPALPIFS